MSVTPRVEKIRQNYVNTKPSISYERARIWTESFKRTEGQPAAIRTAQAFYDTCNELCVNIFEGELIVKRGIPQMRYTDAGICVEMGRR